ncbi:21168_t:CDS:2, partial [Gigaspora rosea]
PLITAEFGHERILTIQASSIKVDNESTSKTEISPQNSKKSQSLKNVSELSQCVNKFR